MMAHAMHPNRLARFVHKWFTEWDSNDFGRASALLTTLIEERPHEAWERILALIGNPEDQEALGWVGAGPLEDLLRRYGPRFIGAVESRARDDAAFCTALLNVWIPESESEHGRRLAALGCYVLRRPLLGGPST
jgi:hypothetical protein